MESTGSAELPEAIRNLAMLHDCVLLDLDVAEIADEPHIATVDFPEDGFKTGREIAGDTFEAMVVAVGSGRRSSAGDLIPVSVQPGDHVLLSKNMKVTSSFFINKKCYMIVKDSDVLAKWKQGPKS